MSGGPGGASRPHAQQVRVGVEGVAHAGLGADRHGGVGGGESRAGAAPPGVVSLVWEDYQGSSYGSRLLCMEAALTLTPLVILTLCGETFSAVTEEGSAW